MDRFFGGVAVLALFILTSFISSAYGHGLGQDQSLPVAVGGRQVVVEAIIRPAAVPFAPTDSPTLVVRTFEQGSNSTIPGIDYGVTIQLLNDTLLDQRFRSLDGIISANLLPDVSISGWQIAGHESALPQDQIEVSLADPVEIRSRILVTGGLYHVSVTLENESPGLAIQDDIKFDLYISISHARSFNAETAEGQKSILIKTYYDDVTDFAYQNGTITFEMPFNWDPAYVALVPVLHMELQFPKSIEALKTNSYKGSLNGIELPAESVQIDDYSSEENRIVHFVVSNVRLSRLADSVQEGSKLATFTLQPSEKPKFPLDLLSAPDEKYLLQLSWGPDVIETGTPITFVMNLQDPLTGDLLRHSSFDFILTQRGSEIYRTHMTSAIGIYSHEYTFTQPGIATLSVDNINAAGESVKLDLVVLQGSNQAPAQPEQPSGCLIATAAFGSELDQHVQYLRNFREQYVLPTASGSAFMNAFNAVYYSFSPQVAEYERENVWLQNAVKVGLYPLFGILMASENAHSVVGGEAGTILAGTTASSLIGAVYLVPAGIAARKVRSRIILAMVVTVASLLLVTLAFIPPALPVTTSVFVLGVAGASAVMTAKIALALRRRYF